MVTLLKMVYANVDKNSLLEKLESHRKPVKKYLCFSLRQWSLLFAILILILSTVFFICVVLGNLHTRDLIQILENDMASEEDKRKNAEFDEGESESKLANIILNERRLKQSRDRIWVYCNMLTNLMWISSLNLCTNGVMIYGLVTMTPIYMYPWLLLSLLTMLMATLVVLLAYVGAFSFFHVNNTMTIIYVVSLVSFFLMWRPIYVYYKRLKIAQHKWLNLRPIIVHAHGGLTHTVEITPKKIPLPPPPSHDK